MICFSRANDILVLRICIRARNNRTFNVYNRGTLQNYSIETYRFTSCAFTFRPLHESPLHRSQNNRSAFFNSAGFLPSRLAPGISFSVSRSGAVNVFTWGAAILELQSYPHPPRLFVSNKGDNMSRTWNTIIEQKIHFPPKSYSAWSLVSSTIGLSHEWNARSC